jgi:hypothetical protein
MALFSHFSRGNARTSKQMAHHAPNAMGNFCFDVTLGYRRLERPLRVKNGR